ncbi:MAG: protein translocase SEC61 complex subunit gamma [Candidatus Hodarchaeota archaeon]
MSSQASTFWENTKRIYKLAKRPTRQEIWMQFKISMLGLFVVGAVGFFIRLIMTVITASPVFAQT